MMTRALLLGVLLVGACADDGLPPVTELHEGLNLLRVDNDIGWVDGAMVKADRVVYFQTRRGPLTPKFYRDYMPKAPLYEIDVRYLDAAGTVFMIQKGGDQFVDPTWTWEPPAGTVPKDMSEREKDIELAEAAVDELQKLEVDPAVLHEHRALAAVGKGFKPEYRRWIKDEQARLGEARFATYSFYSEIHKEGIWYTLWIGDHSAIKAVSSSGWVGYTSNHGSSASSMDRKCTNKTTVNHTLRNPPLQSCSTGYDWNSGGGEHNCHDDTTIQMYNAFYGTCYGTTGGCCDGQGYIDAPGCRF
jgi:hypothetical protein